MIRFTCKRVAFPSCFWFEEKFKAFGLPTLKINNKNLTLVMSKNLRPCLSP